MVNAVAPARMEQCGDVIPFCRVARWCACLIRRSPQVALGDFEAPEHREKERFTVDSSRGQGVKKIARPFSRPRFLALFPYRYHTNNRVHNCEVHTFVFSLPSSPAPSSVAAARISPTAASTQHPQSQSQPSPSKAKSTTAEDVAHDNKARPSSAGRGDTPLEPQLEAYLTGEALAIACASSMSLLAVARVNRVLYQRAREGDGYSLTEAPFYGMLARSGLSEQEMKWIFSALDREGYGKVPAWDFLLALMAFYPGQPARAAAAMTAGGTNEQQVGLREFRMRYQRQVRVGCFGNVAKKNNARDDLVLVRSLIATCTRRA